MEMIRGPSTPWKTNFRRPPELSNKGWKVKGLGEERENCWRLRNEFWRKKDEGVRRIDLGKKIQSPKLPEKVRNF